MIKNLKKEHHINQSKFTYHDMKNSLFVIFGYLELKEYQTAQCKVKEMYDSLSELENILIEKSIVDSMVKSKIQIAKKEMIKVNYCNLALPLNQMIDEFELCIVIGNAIDNAIEACKKIKNHNERYINISFSYFNSTLNILIENSIQPTTDIINFESKTSKKDKLRHGLGLKRIKNIVDKYSGKVIFNQTDSYFSINILFPFN